MKRDVVRCYRTSPLVGVIILSLLFNRSFAFGPRCQQPTSTRHYYSSSSPKPWKLEGHAIVIVSPPGGVGEVAAFKAAQMGCPVRWFVVSQVESPEVSFSQESLQTVANTGGQIELASADVASLLLPIDDFKSAVPAVATWCGSADSLICTFDGVEKAPKSRADQENQQDLWKNAIKVAVQEASKGITGAKIVILSALDSDSSEKESSGGFGKLLDSVTGRKDKVVPQTLREAASNDSTLLLTLRHGQLFGTPETSPGFSALIGGLRRSPELCEEYTMRSIRVDPTISLTGNVMMGSTTRSSRHAVGEAAALMALGKVPVKPGQDVCVSSQLGTDATSLDVWREEFERVERSVRSGGDGTLTLFNADFASVPSVERLSDWLAMKWAPAVLRTYDIASIRVGERPVYALRAGPGKVEIVWQQLKDFESVTSGKMILQVTENRLIASRGPGDASKGFGVVSGKPLSGEDVLVRRLAEGVAQAIEKGLATKPLLKQAPQPVTLPVSQSVTIPMPSVESLDGSSSEQEPVGSTSGPRQAGARRSQQRARGTRNTGSNSQDADSTD